MRLEVDEVGIAPHDDVAVALVQRAPHRRALAVAVSVLGKHLRGGDHPGTTGDRDSGGVVVRVVVDDEDLVDEANVVDELAPNARDDVADRGLFVARRKADRHRPAGLRVGKGTGIELGVVERPQGIRERQSTRDKLAGGIPGMTSLAATVVPPDWCPTPH